MTEPYWAAKPIDDIPGELDRKVTSWRTNTRASRYYQVARKTYRRYYGVGDQATSHGLAAAGLRGELTMVYVNQIRNLAQHLMAKTFSDRVAFKTRPANNDSAAYEASVIADGLLANAVRDLRLDRMSWRALEGALLSGEAFVRVDWDPGIGEEIMLGENGEPIRSGGIRCQMFSTFDTARDPLDPDPYDPTWMIVAESANKHDLKVRYPEHEDEIEHAKYDCWYGPDVSAVLSGPRLDSDVVTVYRFYHKKTTACPDGREVLYLNNKTWLTDGPLSYKRVPVYRVSAYDVEGNPAVGYSPLYDLHGPHDAMNALLSASLSNQVATGVQNILIPRGSNVKVSQLVGGLNGVEYDASLGEPKALQLTSTPAEIFNSIEGYRGMLPDLLGMNATSMGNTETRLSGNAMALLDSKAIQFIRPLQESFIYALNQIGRGILDLYRTRTAAPSTVRIVGQDKQYMMKSFVGSDLDGVDLVEINTTNPVSQTEAFKIDTADKLLQQGLVKSPEQFFEVVDKGSVEPVLLGPRSEKIRIKAENEMILRGEVPQVLATDNHILDIMEHKCVLDNPEKRNDPAVVQAYTQHLMSHIEIWRSLPPDLLQALGMQPSVMVQQGAAIQRGTPDENAPQQEAAAAPPETDQNGEVV